MSNVNEDPQAIDRFRQALPRFSAKQSAALDPIDREIQLTQQALAEACDRARREVDRCNEALRGCIAFALASGGYGDCGAEEWALQAAEERLVAVLEEQRSVDIASDAFSRGEQHYLDYLRDVIPALEAGLVARVESLERYLAWRLSYRVAARKIASVSRASAVSADLAAKLARSGLRPPLPVDARENGAGGPEKLG